VEISEFFAKFVIEIYFLLPVWRSLIELRLLIYICKLQSLAMKQNAEFTEVGKNDGLTLSRLWTKVCEIFKHCR